MSVADTARVGGTRWLAALAGLAAAAVAVGVVTLVAALVAPTATTMLALGGAFIDLTPAWLKDAAIALFGEQDKLALQVGMVVVIAALGAFAGVVGEVRLSWGLGIVILLSAVAGLAAVTRPGAGAIDAVPSLVGAAAGAVALRLLLDLMPGRLAAPRPGARFGPAAAGAAGSPDLPAAGRPAPAGEPPGAEEPHIGDEAFGGLPGQPAAARLYDTPPAPAEPPRPTEPSATTAPRTMARRSFVGLTLGTAFVGAVVSVAGQALGGTRAAVERVRDALRLPRAAREAVPLPPGVDVDVPGVVPFVTPNDRFYRVDTALAPPLVDAETWTLRVHGLVENEVEITYDDLVDEDLVEAWVTLTCVSNPIGGNLAGNAKWLGWPVRELLARARPLPGADMVLSTSADGFTASTPLPVLMDERDALLAIGMNDEPLPVTHGFPVRMVVPGLYGYVSATKWVVDLEVTRFVDATAYWTVRGWAPRAPVKTASRIEVPREAASVRAGAVTVAGTAWAQTRGIERVEVRVDEGLWNEAELAAVPTVDTWRQWSWIWPNATPGRHTLQVRASDPDGPQTAERSPAPPDGATGYHTITVTVRA